MQLEDTQNWSNGSQLNGWTHDRPIIPYLFKYKMHIFHILFCWKIEMYLKLEELFSCLQIVHRVAWKNLIHVNTFWVSHQDTSPTFNYESTPKFQFSHCLTFLLFRYVQVSISFYSWKSILHMMMHSKEKLFCALKR
jgi:hypothetical protein